MKYGKTYWVEIPCGGDCEGKLNAEVHTGYDPYPTQDHDDPRYADPGEPGWVEFEDARCEVCGRLVNDDDEARALAEEREEEFDGGT